ncbi:helix-turn-helix domain-containing protein [Phycicoccus sp.]|uniref:helix-turn-helix transcriptional regulator n=1 Tax=Phycicoccus sp. TaxID=1902410 RepID=UPI002CCFE811|nr:helix-turn-helix domain-containing protein [Phycicoccus sp.]HMM97275.1 helix-turn-helix domain-containing protein [Phycicoccus sp.]
MTTSGESHRDAIAEVSLLADPVRRRLYDYVATRDEPVRRDDAAEAVGVSRTLAAYHLDRLAVAGLLATRYARPIGRGGPGAGRPAKQYERARHEVVLSVPPRNYTLLAQLLADTVAADESGVVRTALMSAAERQGAAAADQGADLLATLVEGGYEPRITDEGRIELRNCPFHTIAQRQTELVCSLNEALARGLLAGRGEDPARAELAPAADRCCVVIRPGPTAAGA